MTDTVDPASGKLDAPRAATSAATPSASARLRGSASWQTLGPFLVFAATLLIVSAVNPAFLGGTGISIVTESAAPILLVALGQAMVLNIGSIDLSNAAISLLGAIVLALLLPAYGFGAITVAVRIVRALTAASRRSDRGLCRGPGPLGSWIVIASGRNIAQFG